MGALVGDKQGLSARAVVLSPSGPSKMIDLGRVHGDVLAPAPASSGALLAVAVPDGAPNGTLIRLAEVTDAAGNAGVKWGAEILEGKDESDAFSIVLGARTGVVVWDEWSTDGGHSVVRAVTFPSGDARKTSPSAVLSGKEEDAESPQLSERNGGFWVAWMTNERREPTKKERAETTDTAEAVDLGPRSISLVALDDAGQVTGSVLSVTRPGGHVMSFDLAPAKEGGALVAFREDKATPGTAGGAIRLASVKADGSVDTRVITEDDVGAEVPALLADDAPPEGGAAAWLSLGTETDGVRLASMDAEGRAQDELGAEPSLGVGAPLVVHGGRILALEPRGQRAELAAFDCTKSR